MTRFLSCVNDIHRGYGNLYCIGKTFPLNISAIQMYLGLAKFLAVFFTIYNSWLNVAAADKTKATNKRGRSLQSEE